MTVSGVQHLVERAYRESAEQQYLRELLVNALEAGATRIEFGPEWGAVEGQGVFRLMVADNGKGMDAENLLRFLNTFGGGGKPIGDAHENYGVGAKTSLLPWNHHGLVVISWTPSNPAGAMVWLMRDPASGEYGARKIQTDEGYHEIVEPFGEWSHVKPEWIEDHGTVVVCLGMTGTEDTFLGKLGDGHIKGITTYLNKRIWEVPDGVEIYVQELRSSKREDWPRSLAEATGPTVVGTVDRRWNRRRVRGARHFVCDVSGGGRLAHHGTEKLSDGTELDWYLWEGERPSVHSYAHINGFIAALYRNELYDTRQHVSQYRSFGIHQATVRTNLTLIARPPLAHGTYGVYPDTARNALKIRGTHRAGEPLPWAEWAEEFAQIMPEPIRRALATAAPATAGSLDDRSWGTRLKDLFSRRWKAVRYVFSPHGQDRIEPEYSGGRTGGRDEGTGGAGGGSGNGPGFQGPPDPRGPVWSTQKKPTGALPATAVTCKGGLPDFEWTTLSNVDEEGRFAAAWCPPSAEKPNGVVQLARDHAVFVELFQFWRDQYPDHVGDQVQSIIERVYGEALVARIAHSEQLVGDKCWGRTAVDNELRSPASLTMAVLGLVSEDHVIRSRLSGLGMRRQCA
jgi:hypothetical protein